MRSKFKGPVIQRRDQVDGSTTDQRLLDSRGTPDNFVLSGYSIAHYPEGIDFDLDQVEKTLSPMPNDKGWNLDYVLGPQRP